MNELYRTYPGVHLIIGGHAVGKTKFIKESIIPSIVYNSYCVIDRNNEYHEIENSNKYKLYNSLGYLPKEDSRVRMFDIVRFEARHIIIEDVLCYLDEKHFLAFADLIKNKSVFITLPNLKMAKVLMRYIQKPAQIYFFKTSEGVFAEAEFYSKHKEITIKK